MDVTSLIYHDILSSLSKTDIPWRDIEALTSVNRGAREASQREERRLRLLRERGGRLPILLRDYINWASNIVQWDIVQHIVPLQEHIYGVTTTPTIDRIITQLEGDTGSNRPQTHNDTFDYKIHDYTWRVIHALKGDGNPVKVAEMRRRAQELGLIPLLVDNWVSKTALALEDPSLSYTQATDILFALMNMGEEYILNSKSERMHTITINVRLLVHIFQCLGKRKLAELAQCEVRMPHNQPDPSLGGYLMGRWIKSAGFFSFVLMGNKSPSAWLWQLANSRERITY